MIVEDEQPAMELLSGYIADLPHWTLVKSCRNAIEALEYLRTQSIDILFLDIEMPLVTGFELLESLDKPPITIITSAYTEYGVKAYEFEVFDYLLKPYSFARILKTYQKIERQADGVLDLEVKNEQDAITIKVKGNNMRLRVSDIRYVESQRSYIHIATSKETSRTKMSIWAFENLLPASRFLRVHRSYLVAVQHVDSFNRNEIIINEVTIPIGRNYKQSVMDALEC